MLIKPWIRALGAATLLLTFSTSPAHASEEWEPPSVTASFEGRRIRLADDWGEAQACTSDGVTARCYRSETQMAVAEGERSAGHALDMAIFADCAYPGVRLYRGASWGGGVLQLTVRYTLIDLATYGFNNDTSSYLIGACAAGFYDTSSGGTSYPGNTSAGVSASSMLAGWDNRVSSVYIF